MASQTPSPQQGGSSGQTQQQQQQQGSSVPQQPGQQVGAPIFRDWAAI